MACVVAGFPSNIAALQFEWAWHNAHLTRHIAPDERISFATTRTKTSAKTGKTTRKPGRPRTSLMDKLSNLHLLLRVPYFSQWPLELRFFSEDAYRSWVTWCGRIDTHIRAGINVHFDPAHTRAQDEETEFTSAQPAQRTRKADLIGKGGVDGVDPTYARLRGVFEKSKFLLDEDDGQTCSVCQGDVDLHKSLFVLCHNDDCRSMSHITCLADSSLKSDGSASIVPRMGICPTCKQKHPWPELMQQVTLRTRGIKEVQKLQGKKGKTTAATAAEILESEGDEEEEDVDAEALRGQQFGVDEPCSSDDENASLASVDSFDSRASNNLETSAMPTGHAARLEIVVEDSEDET